MKVNSSNTDALQGEAATGYTNTQIQINKYKYTNTNTQIQIHKYKYTNTNTQIHNFRS